MDYTEYTKVKADIMTICRCTEYEANAMLNRVIALGGDIRKWTAGLVKLMNDAHPTAEDVIASLDKYADDSGKRNASYGSFMLPHSYMSREARRKAAKADAKKRRQDAQQSKRLT